MTTKLVKCTCAHEVQDTMYGKGNRMANEARTGQYRCTVCSTLHGSASLTTATKKAKEPIAEPAKTEKKAPAKKEPEKKNEKGKGGKKDKKSSMQGGKRRRRKK